MRNNSAKVMYKTMFDHTRNDYTRKFLNYSIKR